MTYRGRIRDGVIVLDEDASLPDGTEVEISVVRSPDRAQSLSEKLLSYAGKANGLPSDLARNHDHYLHGAPKR